MLAGDVLLLLLLLPLKGDVRGFADAIPVDASADCFRTSLLAGVARPAATAHASVGGCSLCGLIASCAAAAGNGHDTTRAGAAAAAAVGCKSDATASGAAAAAVLRA
jgi:hypothetical protein